MTVVRTRTKLAAPFLFSVLVLATAGCAKSLPLSPSKELTTYAAGSQRSANFQVLVQPLYGEALKLPGTLKLKTKRRFWSVCNVSVDLNGYQAAAEEASRRVFQAYFNKPTFGNVSNGDLTTDISGFDAVLRLSFEKWTQDFDCGRTISGPYCEYFSEVDVRGEYRIRGREASEFVSIDRFKVKDPHGQNSRCGRYKEIAVEALDKGIGNGINFVARRLFEELKER